MAIVDKTIIADAAGDVLEITAANAAKVDGSAVTQPVSGTVTANAGTNLNTSALALEAGGNLASIKAKTDNIPAQGQALAAASLPVVLTAAQITTLTPIAGALEATLQSVKTAVELIDNFISGTKGLVTEDNSAAIKTAVELIDDSVAVLGTATYTEATTKGMIIGGVRRDADTTLVDTTNEIAPLQINSAGQLKVEIFDSGDSHTIDAPVGTPAFVRLSDGAAAITTLPVSLASVPSHAVTNAGTFATQIDGSALTALQLLDDVVIVLGTDTYTEATSKGGIIAAVRRDADTPLANTTNEYSPLITDANGYLKVEVFDGGGTHTVDAPVGTPVNVQIGNATLSVGVIDETGSGAVDALAVGGGTAHDAVDSGNPVKIGFKAITALPTAVAASDRTNAISDLWGRQLTAHIDPAQFISKAFNATTTQTGTDVWSPASGKKIAVTSIVIGAYATTAARLILWFGANADTTYSAGTDQLILAASFAPSGTVKPGLVFTPASPIFAATADHEIHCTTDAGISVDISVAGYEY